MDGYHLIYICQVQTHSFCFFNSNNKQQHNRWGAEKAGDSIEEGNGILDDTLESKERKKNQSKSFPSSSAMFASTCPHFMAILLPQFTVCNLLKDDEEEKDGHRHRVLRAQF